MKNDRASNKVIKKCKKILGKEVTVGYLNGNLPNGVVMAIVGNGTNIYFVNLKKKNFVPYIVDGEFKMKKATGQTYKVFRPSKTEETLEMYAEAAHADLT